MIIFGSILVLALIQAFKSNFNAAVEYHRWRQLTWDDFQGFPVPFSHWGAGINSDIYLEFDSLGNTYRAYAAMNNQKSWRKSKSVESDYLLNHEQYHFNITEYFARKLNAIIESKGYTTEAEIMPELSSLRRELSIMQDRYDAQSEHSSKQDMQRKWEFKIDSMLHVFDKDSGFVTDHYSGASVLMPSKYELFEKNGNQTVIQQYVLLKYDMQLVMNSIRYEGYDVDFLKNELQKYYLNDSVQVLNIQHDSSYQLYQNLELYHVKKQKIEISKLLYENGFFYVVSAFFPDSLGDGYRDIAKTFVNSFRIKNTDQYWIDRLDDISLEFSFTQTSSKKQVKSTPADQELECLVFGSQRSNIYFSGPIFEEDGSMILPFKIMGVADSLIQEITFFYNDVKYSFAPNPEDQIVFLPAEHIQSGKISINFGYILKEDAEKECYTFYHKRLEIQRHL